jgi:hypothetical protein
MEFNCAADDAHRSRVLTGLHSGFKPFPNATAPTTCYLALIVKLIQRLQRSFIDINLRTFNSLLLKGICADRVFIRRKCTHLLSRLAIDDIERVVRPTQGIEHKFVLCPVRAK